MTADADAGFRRATRLEWLTVGYLATVVVVMFLARGSSQSMKSAWLEDVLGPVPAVSFLIAARVVNRPPSRRFPFGLRRAFGVAYLTSSLALLAMGGFLLIDGALTLWRAEHPTIDDVTIGGAHVWGGWIMLGALVYSSVPSVFLGRAKHPLARSLHNKNLHTDAEAQKADYQTAVAAMLGVGGVALGLWWADAVFALVIAVAVTRDGAQNVARGVLDLIDRRPMTIDGADEHPVIRQVEARVAGLTWVRASQVRLREDGQSITGDVIVVPKADAVDVAMLEAARADLLAIDAKLRDLNVAVVSSLPDRAP